MSAAAVPPNRTSAADNDAVSGTTGFDDPSAGARFHRAYPPAAPRAGRVVRYLAFRGGDIVLHGADEFPTTPVSPIPDGAGLYLGDLDGEAIVAFPIPKDAALPDGWEAVGLRGLWGRVDEESFAVAGYGAQLLHFHEYYQFCSRCGTRTEGEGGTWGRKCPNCGHSVYPPVSPAVLALIHDGGDRVLLAQKPGWGKRFSIIAGFVEPGESFEGCVIREAMEEVGVRVVDPVYIGSQPWPFPHQVMVGFTTLWNSGEIRIDEAELSDARWFHWNSLPELPPPLSLSRQLIDRWVSERRRARDSKDSAIE